MRKMTNGEINGILNRIKELRKIDEDIVKDLINSLCRYTKSVFDDNFKTANITRIRENANSLEEYQQKVEEIELNRKMAHDRLITDIKVADMFCRMSGIQEIYGELPKEYQKDTTGLMGEANRKNPGVVETRHNIAEWAWGVITGAVISMDLDITGIDYSKDINDFKQVGETYSDKKARKILDDLTNPEI